MKNIVSSFTVILILVSALILGFDISPVKASGTIYIRADGSIDPPTAPILRNGDFYTLTGNITSDADGIIVQKGHITLDGAGCTLQGSGVGYGFNLTGINYVAISNVIVTSFNTGIYLLSSSNNSVSSTFIYGNIDFGVQLLGSSNNTVSSNHLVYDGWGCHLFDSGNNTLSGNWITNNDQGGILTGQSSGNIISDNSIMVNYYGISTIFSSNYIIRNDITQNQYGIDATSSSNRVYHNNFINALEFQFYRGGNILDDGYPSGGNYWFQYNGADSLCGPYQDISGSDGLGDTSYAILSSEPNPTHDYFIYDRYPLMKPYAGPHDIGVTSIATSKTVVGQGYATTVGLKVVNYGVSSEVLNVTLYANASSIVTFTLFFIAERNSVNFTFDWNTAGIDLGNYTISAHASPVPGETDTTDNMLYDGWVFVTIPGDLDANGLVDIFDITRIALRFGEVLPQPVPWPYPPEDINSDGFLDIFDIVVVALHFGETS